MQQNKDVVVGVNTAEEMIKSFINLTKSIPGDSHKSLLVKGKHIATLNNINKQLLALQETIQEFVRVEQESIFESIQQVENSLNQTKMVIKNNAWARKPQLETVHTHTHPTPQHQTTPAQTTTPTTHQLVKREIANNVFIDAYTIKAVEDCHKWLGFWCYLPNHNRFYLSINNTVLEAITTIIIPPEQQPNKCLEHRDTMHEDCTNVDWQKSKFYVPRIFNKESRDIRQFTGRMKFVPASRELRENEIYTYRIGSRDTLPDDLNHLTPQDFRMFNDLTGNFLLCHTAAAQKERGSQTPF